MALDPTEELVLQRLLIDAERFIRQAQLDLPEIKHGRPFVGALNGATQAVVKLQQFINNFPTDLTD